MRRPAWTSRWSWALLGLALAGCSPRAELEACNIARKSCQENIYYAVLRLRGDGFDPFQGVPPIRTITLAQYTKELNSANRQGNAADTSKQTRVDPWDVALQLLGLVTTQTSVADAAVSDRVNNVAAYYSWDSQDVTVIDRGDQHDDAADTTLLAHELVHAFQSREQAASISSPTTDGTFAGQALTEGEAVLYEQLVGAELRRLPPQDLDWEGYYSGWASGLRTSLAQQTSPFYAVSWFVYPFGADLLTRAWLTGGNAAVRRLGTDFPRHALEYMASLDHKHASAGATVGCEPKPPSDAFTLAGLDRFGAMQLYAFLEAGGLSDDAAWTGGLGWRDDELWVYFDQKSQEVALTWRIRTTSAAAADELVAVASKRPGLSATRVRDDAIVVGTKNADLLASWAGAAECK